MATRIYTRTGDAGQTGLMGPDRVWKDDARIEACGAIDELNARLGAARNQSPDPDIDAHLVRLQNTLLQLGADVATPAASGVDQGGIHVERVSADQVLGVEHEIDRYEQELSPLHNFILPGGVPLASSLHLARTACRQAERRLVTLMRRPDSGINGLALKYVNRLADLLFVMARLANHRANEQDVVWRG
ncbi:MAG: cob(I)yrinic acid a,c-diamide adenosyltransferase [Armatimonadetes bacterium]|nr:cob(I)yrinic acid a,c-diamide adenosyltransferase [Armatimonadota bacterium]MDE2205130.1 cob(I)yrinic acid a,c-diamide adenosyltransferase [Armatimonadota bacterium]